MELRDKNAFHGQFTDKLERDLETWLTLSRKQTQFKKKEKLSKTNDLIIFLSYFSASMGNFALD